MTDTAITGTCHCGAVCITLPRTPDFVNECNCTLRTKLGGLWCYFSESEVRIEAAPGVLAAYIRADLDETWLSTHHLRLYDALVAAAGTDARPDGRESADVRG